MSDFCDIFSSLHTYEYYLSFAFICHLLTSNKLSKCKVRSWAESLFSLRRNASCTLSYGIRVGSRTQSSPSSAKGSTMVTVGSGLLGWLSRWVQLKEVIGVTSPDAQHCFASAIFSECRLCRTSHAGCRPCK